MKKLLFMLVAFPSLLFGCSHSREDLVEYNHSELSAELAEKGIEPKLPTEFPVAIEGYEIFEPPHKSSRYETSLTGKNGEIFTLTVHTAPVSYEGNIEKEDVKINGNEGFYTENEVTGPSLHWTEGDYHYILEYRTIGFDTVVNKETMLDIAESFE
ncbi:DUF4367 domain-containing protein [Bacillus sp. SG-1]|uniref:DUF4367 domain-containing protein n=1 Tax=Bacillus sp. SG-1 TaxID=161544 RepID=UPI000154363E|nr:DUF4367 domain-containing protein [Bacillus sp. SG-1]EDL66511.1 hypothetical protein BSG1_04125 [Bacillus sp. SG-1]